MTDDRRDRGLAVLDQLDVQAAQHLHEALDDVAPHLAAHLVEFAFGEVYSRPVLDLRTREVVAIASLAAQGGLAPQLRAHVEYALNVGWTRDEIVEMLVEVMLFAGVPAAMNGIAAAREAFAAHDGEGA